MIKRYSYIFILSAIFLVLSGVGYYIHYLIFRDAHHIFLYLIGDLAFLPLEVLLVGVFIERIMSNREKQSKLQKLNMVIGAFFSQAGNYLLSDLLNSFKNKEEICLHLNVTATWTKKDFQKAIDFASRLPIEVNSENLDLEKLKAFLSQRREFLITLLENPSLLEHDRFTDLLWATTHLDEELEARQSFDNLPPSDREHIIADIRRMYDHLSSEWLDYVVHLKLNYPYLFSLILRTHPFQKKRSAFVT
jgi:hypothetical protein